MTFKIEKEENLFYKKKKTVLEVQEYIERERNVLGQGALKKPVKTSIALYQV